MESAPSLAPPSAFEGLFLTEHEALTAASGSTGPVTIRPAAVAVPSGLSDLVALVEAARSRGWTLTPRAGATGMPGGNVGHGVAVDMATGFRAIEGIDPDRGIARAGVGATLSEIDEAARPFGLELPPLPSSAHRCLLGGALANNAAGSRSFLHGAIRPWVEAIEAVLADGTVLELGDEAPPTLLDVLREGLEGAGDWRSEWPQVRKNSSGYALAEFQASRRIEDLIIGSEGTLALLTRADVRLRPRPELRRLHAVRIPTMDHLPEITEAALSVGASTCEFLGDRLLQLGELESDPLVGELARGSWGLALVETEGTVDQVEESAEELERVWTHSGLSYRSSGSAEAMEALWGVRRRASPTIAKKAGTGRTSVQFIEDSVVPPPTSPTTCGACGASWTKPPSTPSCSAMPVTPTST